MIADQVRKMYEELVADLNSAFQLSREHQTHYEEDPSLLQRQELWAVLNFLRGTGNEDFLPPLEELLFDLEDAALRAKHGGAITPFQETWKLAFSAAAVTALRDRGVALDHALDLAASFFELDKDRVRKFRDNVSRKKISEPAQFSYDTALRLFQFKNSKYLPELIAKAAGTWASDGDVK